MYDDVLFAPRTKQYLREDPLPVRTPPKLAVVCVTSEIALMKGTQASNGMLLKFISALTGCIHPLGTLAFAMPRPWYKAGAHVGGAYSIHVK